MTHIEALKQAIDALEHGLDYAKSEQFENAQRYKGYEHLAPNDADSVQLIETAITSLRQVIAEAEKQEPVAMQMDVIVVNLVREGINKHRARELAEHFIKHTHPQPKREPLTEMQIIEATEHIDESRHGYFIHIARAIEAAHGIGAKK